jgi:group I intron endonuclease
VSSNVIYKIRNVVNGKFYVGSAVDTRTRFRQHRRLLRKNIHHCKHLQAAWNKYGEDAFKFEVVEHVACREELEPREEVWLSEHAGQLYCYNSGRSARAPWRGTRGSGLSPLTGTTISPERKDRLREATLEQWQTSDPRTGRKHSEEAKAKIKAKVQKALAEGRGGRFIPSDETRAKMSSALKGNKNAKGHVRTEDHRRKLSEAQKGNQHWAGKSHSEESKAKMGKAVRMISPGGEVTVYPRTTAIKEQLGIFLPTVLRSVRSGKPLSRGPYTGWRFEYV